MRKTGMAALVLLAGCISHPTIRPLRPLEIPTAPYQEVVTSSLVGSLAYEGGCLLFHDEKSHGWLLPVWPAGTTFNGSEVFFHVPHKPDQRLVVTEEFVMGGQPLSWSKLPAGTYQPIEHQCGAYQPFLVSSVRPAD
jgi:hypothetical protein